MMSRISQPVAALALSVGVFTAPAVSLAQSSATELEAIVVTAQRKFLPEVSNDKIYPSQYASPDLGIAYAYPTLIKGRVTYSF
jgi:hypothetical protein